jgi:hypothetical protein
MKLTDTHRTILAAAGARENSRVLPLPKSLKLSTAKAEALLTALLASELIAETPVSDGDIAWRTDDASGKLTLIVTPSGLAAVGIEVPAASSGDAPSKPRVTRSAAKAPSKSSKRDKKSPQAARLAVTPAPRANTKLATLVAALRTKKGATITDLTEATGWQAHSVRGAISGALKKKQKLNVVSTVTEGRGRVYRIAG